MTQQIPSNVPNSLPTLAEEREIYLYFRLLTAEDYLTMDTLANELYTSKTTISRDIHSMRDLINAVNGISLKISRKNGIILQGEEQYIRFRLADFPYCPVSFPTPAFDQCRSQ